MPENKKTKDFQVPEATIKDTAHSIVRAGLGSFPLVGSALSELFSKLIAPPLQRRKDKWMQNVAEMLNKLAEDEEITLEELQKNDSFIDLLMNASQAALRNANTEKHKALRNSIHNAAIGRAPAESLQHMFVRYIDEMTEWHLRILKLFQNPRSWAQKNNHEFPDWYNTGLSSLLEDAFPELKGDKEFYSQVWRDLNLRGLVNTDQLMTSMSPKGLFASRTTDLGNKFLEFIEEPL